MSKIFSKLNIYDHVGYLLVGSIGIMVFFFNFWLLEFDDQIPSFDFNDSLVWFVAAYFIGHVIQSLANLVIKENKSEFSKSEKEILEKAKEYFKIEGVDWNEAHLYCYMLSSAKDITGHVQSFNAYYSLYRGWFVVFLLESVVLLIINLLSCFNLILSISFLFSTILSFLFRARMVRFYNYSRSKTLQTFVLLNKLGI